MNEQAARALFEAAREVVQRLHEAGYIAYWAGGCVRDMLLNRVPKDVDIATNATPERVQELFPQTREVGKAFAVIQVQHGGYTFEVASFRREFSYRDGRHPDAIELGTPEEDARRRDFTINGLFYDPLENRVLDFVGGQEDLARKQIRAIGDPRSRFQEDYLRLIRAVRFAARLEFEIEPATGEAIRELAPLLARVSAERLQQELNALLTESPRPGHAVRLLHEYGLLRVILPEVEDMVGQSQPAAYHPEGDVFEHTVKMLDLMKDPTVELAWAVLLHDVGKPRTARVGTEPDGSSRVRFHEHDSVGAELAREILTRLRMPTRVIETVAHCVGNHMRFMNVMQMRRSKLRQLVGAPTFPLELELHRLDCLASHGDLTNYEFLRKFAEELRNEPALPAPWVTGHDIMALGIPQGPRVGYWQKRAYEAQLENRFPDRESLLSWLRAAIIAEETPRMGSQGVSTDV